MSAGGLVILALAAALVITVIVMEVRDHLRPGYPDLWELRRAWMD